MAKTLNLKSGIQKQSRKHFNLKEDDIRRIEEILNKAAKDLSHETAVVYHVKRKDSRFYETINLDDVLADPNISSHEIASINIELRNADPQREPRDWEDDWIVMLEFVLGDKYPVELMIFGEKKGWALLLADELMPQVERTELKNGISDYLLLPLYASVAFLGFRFLSSLQYSSKIAPGLLYTGQVLIVLAALATSFVTLDKGKQRAGWLRKLLGPESVFAWGGQASIFDKRQRVRTAILWTVIIGFLVSTAANAFWSYLSSGQ